jgi:hypothetical protein
MVRMDVLRILMQIASAATESTWAILGTTAYGFWLVPIAFAAISWWRNAERTTVKVLKEVAINAFGSAIFVFIAVFSVQFYRHFANLGHLSMDIITPPIPALTQCVIQPQSCIPVRDQKPDVSLKIVDPQFPALIFINKSAVIAREYKYWFTLFNLNRIQDGHPRALPVPSATGDWIRPFSAAGPMGIFFSVESELTAGDRIVGIIGVTCPTCQADRRFVVDISYKRGGWYAEMTSSEIAALQKQVKMPDQIPNEIPDRRRQPIDNR